MSTVSLKSKWYNTKFEKSKNHLIVMSKEKDEKRKQEKSRKKTNHIKAIQ